MWGKNNKFKRFPLYYMQDGDFERTANFRMDAIKSFESRVGIRFVSNKTALQDEFEAFDLFCYIYAVLYAPRYREKYKDFLNRDFPIVPYPSKKEFWVLSALGKELVDAHLLRKPYECENVAFVGSNRTIEKVSFEDGKVFINKNSGFEKIPDAVWEFIVGGYQPCHRWLRERKGRRLSEDDISHYKSIIGAIQITLKIMDEIDRASMELF